MCAIIKPTGEHLPLLGRCCRGPDALDVGLASLDERLAYIDTSKNDDPRTVKLMQEVCDLLRPHKKAEAPRANGDPALSAILRGVVGSHESRTLFRILVTRYRLVNQRQVPAARYSPSYRLALVKPG